MMKKEIKINCFITYKLQSENAFDGIQFLHKTEDAARKAVANMQNAKICEATIFIQTPNEMPKTEITPERIDQLLNEYEQNCKVEKFTTWLKLQLFPDWKE